MKFKKFVREVSMVLQGNLKEVSRKFKKCFKRISRIFQESFKAFLGTLKGVSRES